MKEYLAGQMKIFIFEDQDTQVVCDDVRQLVSNDIKNNLSIKELYRFFIPEGRFLFQLPIDLTIRYKK